MRVLKTVKSVSAGLLLFGTVVLPGVYSPVAFASERASDKSVNDTKAERPILDLAFLIDTTGSMGGEIEMVKKKTKDLVAKLASGKPAPRVRVGLVAYRDRGDEYVTKVFPFSDDIDKVVKDITSLSAAGGGDTPEAVNQGMHAALNELAWSKDKRASKLLFLIGDATPHIYSGDYKWEDEAKNAISRGIQINTIGCNGLDTGGTAIFEKIAKLADGKFEDLAYRREIVSADGKKETLITSGRGTYKLKAGSEGAWKAGARELEAKGLAVAAPVSAAESSMASADFASAPGRMASASPASAGAFAKRSRSGGYGGAGGAGVNRGDSNLDEMMLNAAKAKLKKDLSVDYK